MRDHMLDDPDDFSAGWLVGLLLFLLLLLVSQ